MRIIPGGIADKLGCKIASIDEVIEHQMKTGRFYNSLTDPFGIKQYDEKLNDFVKKSHLYYKEKLY